MKFRIKASTDTSDLEAHLRAKVGRVRSIVIRSLVKETERAYTEEVQGTWDHKFPVTSEVNEARGVADVSMSGKVPHWLNKGTKVRYATMKEGYILKTSPGIMRSSFGGGEVAFVSKSKPNPGIEARNIDQSVADWIESQAAEIVISAWNKS